MRCSLPLPELLGVTDLVGWYTNICLAYPPKISTLEQQEACTICQVYSKEFVLSRKVDQTPNIGCSFRGRCVKTYIHFTIYTMGVIRKGAGMFRTPVSIVEWFEEWTNLPTFHILSSKQYEDSLLYKSSYQQSINKHYCPPSWDLLSLWTAAWAPHCSLTRARHTRPAERDEPQNLTWNTYYTITFLFPIPMNPPAMIPTRTVVMNPMADVQAYEILYR